jgi:hypothetical protein
MGNLHVKPLNSTCTTGTTVLFILLSEVKVHLLVMFFYQEPCSLLQCLCTKLCNVKVCLLHSFRPAVVLAIVSQTTGVSSPGEQGVTGSVMGFC